MPAPRHRVRDAHTSCLYVCAYICRERVCVCLRLVIGYTILIRLACVCECDCMFVCESVRVCVPAPPVETVQIDNTEEKAVAGAKDTAEE